MLEVIRNNAQSWGVKLLFGIIVLVFVFWGVGSFRNPERRVVASVGDQEIGLKEFVQNYQRQVEALRRQRGELSSQDLKNMDLKRQVLEQMINARLLQTKAEELGLVVGSGQVRTKIRGMSVFHGDNATFDPSRYQGLLRMNNLTPAQFESDIRRDLVSTALRQVVTSPVLVEESEAREMFDYIQAKASIDYVRFPVQDYVQQVEVSDKQIRAYYEQHKQKYEIPAQMSMQAVTLTPKTLAAEQGVAWDEIETYYARHKDEFTRPEQVKARHILIRVGQEASEEEVRKAREQINAAAVRVEQGADFEQVAMDVSQGPSADQGGDLGWFGRDSMVPEFEKAAFGLQPGELSEPVRTKFGFHLIKVTDRREAGVQPLDEVQEKIRSRLARDKAMQVLEDRLDEVLHIVLTSGDLQRAAEEVDLQVQDIGPFSRENLPQQFDLSQKQVNTLMQMQDNEVLDTPIMLDNGYLVVQKTGHEPAHIPDLDQIEDTVRQAVTKNRAAQLAQEAAQEALSRLEQGQAAQELGLQVETSQPFSRQGVIPGLGRNQALVQDVFAAKRDKWLQKPYELAEAVVVARLADLSPPEDGTWEAQKDFWMDNVRRIQEQALFQAYMQGLREAAEVSIKAPQALEYS